jgi:hypothetical protein
MYNLKPRWEFGAFFGVLQLVLIFLKVNGLIDWPWVAVCAPIVLYWVVHVALIFVLIWATKKMNRAIDDMNQAVGIVEKAQKAVQNHDQPS